MSKVARRVKVEDRNQDILVEVPMDRVNQVKEFLDRNLSWRVTKDNYKLFEDETVVRNKFNPEGVSLFYYHMRQNEKPKGIVFTFHGYGASQRIDTSWTANFLAGQGFEVVGFDNEGHGRNVPKAEDRCEIKNYRKLFYNGVSFIEFFLERERKRLKDVPIFLWGMSMGGAIVGNILCNEDFKSTVDKLSGAVLCAPHVESPLQPPKIIFQLIVLISSLLPTRTFGEGAIQISESYDDYLEWFKNHEDTYSKPIKLAMAREIVRLGVNFKENAHKITTPVLLLHGTEDSMCRYSSSVNMFKSIRSQEKTIVRLKGFDHGILYDRCTPEVLDIVHQWLNIRVKKVEGVIRPISIDEEDESEGEYEV